ncbi:hypothetical protein PMAYCL1PPCAC_00682 [Pristionchus mayeri]|uniref:Uncharacterized protein n=1 Tax=Pristionchus mayeri TaxID=1317129 RepID=A0AAN5C6M9_9BILA|nr:hypothetical protein PMAYCL1PPCAC_00682 [Pristionchus mayeri]
MCLRMIAEISSGKYVSPSTRTHAFPLFPRITSKGQFRFFRFKSLCSLPMKRLISKIVWLGWLVRLSKACSPTIILSPN